MIKRYLSILLAMSLVLFMWSCSDPDEDDTEAPATPANFTYSGALSGDGGVYLTWDPNTESDFAGYVIYRSYGSVGFTLIATIQEHFYMDSGLDYDTEYSYKVAALDDEGNESGFTSVVSVTPINLNPPDTPQNLTIKAHNLPSQSQVNVELTWTHNTEADFSHYKIFRSDVSDLFATNASSFLDSTTENFYVDENVTPGTTYHYKLIAYDQGGILEAPAAGPLSDIPLEVPTLVSPIGGTSIDTTTPTFHWVNVDGAVKYKIIVRTSWIDGNIWESTIDAIEDAAEMTVTYPSNPTTPLAATTPYYWFVSGYSKDTEDINVFTPVTDFRTP
ncbi:MAG: hypothetical protein HOB84_04870 [Candidatus Marinimicrobia bacterium]|jgi:hypothetical protein|nr:hypothetical protein [Candidatus Neomarinimicrobiota bacterium]MBT4714085.1 hypothetical protein [Candidatus Neomarinimicrobiota bacterium]MBT4944779.1 hypothetical protein [Candidatus Neomarinimicrobiota bacterium]MBT5270432.1 hypothetical protein [Candidatus Neomarinimicrobiota bacterium]MBT6011801.1 hypothetical protein [Candidatus Neomarinimicrobiota bacterium]